MEAVRLTIALDRDDMKWIKAWIELQHPDWSVSDAIGVLVTTAIAGRQKEEEAQGIIEQLKGESGRRHGPARPL